MQNIVFKLLANENRPVAILEDFHNVYAMIDTGSVLPVWCGKERVIRKYGAKKILDEVTFGGFGGMTKGKLYQNNTRRWRTFEGTCR